ncbi:hypothetical protein KPH14_000820, partial [Odynerus spinipes]
MITGIETTRDNSS